MIRGRSAYPHIPRPKEDQSEGLGRVLCHHLLLAVGALDGRGHKPGMAEIASSEGMVDISAPTADDFPSDELQAARETGSGCEGEVGWRRLLAIGS